MQKEWINTYAAQWLGSKTSLYAVDSEVMPKLHYAAKGDEFMLIMGHQVFRMGLHEVDEWIRRCKDPDLAEEMREVVDDIIENGRGQRIYGRPTREKTVSEGGHPIRNVSLKALNTRREWM